MRSENHFILFVHSPRWGLLETTAPRVPHRHCSSTRLLQGHQESHHPCPDEEGWPRGLYSPVSGDWTQEVPSGATEKQYWAPRHAKRGRPIQGAGGTRPGALQGTEATRGRQEQALVVVLLHVTEPAQTTLAAQVLGATARL